MVIKKEILFPIFLECIKYTDDIFWENVFEDLSYGKTPYGTYISKNFFCCNYKDKGFNYKIEEDKDPQELYNDIYTLLVKKLCLLSQKDKIKKRLDFFNIEEDKDMKKTWSSIRKKNIKDLLIENYVISMKNKHYLTFKQARYLISIIYIGMIFKVITVKDIDYNDGKINNILGIEFKKKEIILLKDIYNIKLSKSCILIEEKNLMSLNWTKYIDNLKKLVII